MASDALISALMKDVSEGLEVLRVRDGVELTDAQIEERCRNIVTGLASNYFVSALKELTELPVQLQRVNVTESGPHAIKGPCATCDRDPCKFAFYPVTHRAGEPT